MQIARWDQLLVAFKRWIIPFTVMIGIVLITLGLFVLLFGWERFLADFWPLDNSRVGPNLCASIVVVILITAHNEYRTILQDERHHKRVKDILKDAAIGLLHQTESNERRIANDTDRNEP